jgi:Integrase core domain/Protein of unknown function (DUF2924)
MDPTVIAAINELPQSKVAALKKRYRELFGEESKSSNKQFLLRRIAWRLLFLAISQIRHCRTEVRSPQTNGFCGRFHRTVKEEFFSQAFRQTLYESVAQLQQDLDRYLEFYNRERAHRGYRTRAP